MDNDWETVWQGSAAMAGLTESMLKEHGLEVRREAGPGDGVRLSILARDLETARQLLKDWELG